MTMMLLLTPPSVDPFLLVIGKERNVIVWEYDRRCVIAVVAKKSHISIVRTSGGDKIQCNHKTFRMLYVGIITHSIAGLLKR